MAIIYKITNLINNKVYIGQTVRPLQRRWNQHIIDAQNHKNEKNHFHSAIRKYGKQNFKAEVIETCLEEQLNEKEKYWINFYDSYNNGYNSTLGGDGMLKHEPVDINQVSDLINQGFTLEEISKKINVSPKIISRQLKQNGVYEQLQKRIKINKNAKPVYQWDNVGNLINIFNSQMDVEQQLGFNHKAISQAIKNKTRSANFYWTFGEKPEYKHRIAQYDLQGNFIKYWKDTAQAGKILHLDPSSIGKCCRGQRYNCGGYIWKQE